MSKSIRTVKEENTMRSSTSVTLKVSRVMVALALYVAVFTLNPVTLQAQPSPQVWGPTDCVADPTNLLNNAEAFALGNIWANGMTVDEGNDYLALYTPVFAALCKMDVSYTTQYAHSVEWIEFHMGSSADVAEEWAWWVDVTLPVPMARTIKLPMQQYDKHWANGPGSLNSGMPLHLTMPIGTVIRIRRPYVICLGIPNRTVVNPNPAIANDYGPYNQGNCITGQAVTFVGQ